MALLELCNLVLCPRMDAVRLEGRQFDALRRVVAAEAFGDGERKQPKVLSQLRAAAGAFRESIRTMNSRGSVAMRLSPCSLRNRSRIARRMRCRRS